jgi:hypothetical protein
MTRLVDKHINCSPGAVLQLSLEKFLKLSSKAFPVTADHPVVFKNSILLIHGWGDFATK